MAEQFERDLAAADSGPSGATDLDSTLAAKSTSDLLPAGVRGGRLVTSDQLARFKIKLKSLGIDLHENVADDSWLYQSINAPPGSGIFATDGPITGGPTVILPKDVTVSSAVSTRAVSRLLARQSISGSLCLTPLVRIPTS
jgi:hypothetical protein